MLPVSQLQFRVVCGTNPKNIPVCELDLNLALRFRGGWTQTQQQKVQKLAKVFLLPSGLKNTREILLRRSKHISDAKVVKEGIWSEFDIKSSTFQESTNMITNRSMSAFDGSILMGGICSSWMDLVVPVGKDILDIRIGVELSTLIKVYILVLTSRTILEKELSKPFNRQRFASLNRSPLHPGEVIGD